MGPMRQANKDTQTSGEAEDVSIDRKGKKSTQTRSPGVDSNVEVASSNGDESLHSSGDSPIVSAKTRRAGRAYRSEPSQKTSNTNEHKSPIMSKIILFVIYFSPIHLPCSVSIAK